MKKKLLLGAILFGSFLTANAQDSCDAATAVTTGQYSVSAINGAYEAGCYAGNSQNAPAAEWYAYTATANGYLTVSSAITGNANGEAGIDTRLSILTGTCAALECYGYNDDVDPNATTPDYRSEATVPVESGTVYYIVWDNNWQNQAFVFDVTFTAADCVSPNVFGFQSPSVGTDSASLSWMAAPGSPDYDVMYGAVGFTTDDTTGTTVSVDTNSADLSDLPAEANLWYYVRSNCGDSQGDWVGPFALTLAAGLDYSNGFDDAANRADGFRNLAGWGLSTDENEGATLSHSPTGFLFSALSTTGASNSWILAKPVVLVAGEEVTFSYYAQLLTNSATLNATLNVTVGMSSDISTHDIVDTYTFAGSAAYANHTFTYTADVAGTYYFAFNNASAQAAGNNFILLDTVILDSNLGSEDFLASQFSIYPNPASDVINIANAENILVNGVQIVDLNGRVVKSAKFNGVTEAQINISDLSSGMYLMNVSSDQGTITKKIVKK